MKDLMTRKEKFWLHTFTNDFAPIDLRLCLHGVGEGHATLHIPVPRHAREAVLELTKGVKPAVLACFVCALRILIHRYFGLSDTIILSPATRTIQPELTGNMLYLRTDLAGQGTVRSLLNAELKNIREALVHQDYNADVLTRRAMLNYHVDPLAVEGFRFAFDDLQADPAWLRNNSIDIRLYANTEGGWVLRVVYAEKISKAFVLQLIGHFLTFAGNLPGMLDKPVYEAEILSVEERQQLLRSFSRNDEIRRLSPDETLPGVFHRNVLRRAKGKAVVQGDAWMSYEELDRLSDRLAICLLKRGVRKGDVVAQLMSSCFGLVVSQVAIWKCGALVLSIDKATPEKRISSMLEDSGARVLLTAGEDWPQSRCPVMNIDGIDYGVIEGKVLVDDLKGTDPAYLFYTSGSTGKSKGVVLTHQNICAQLEWMKRYFDLGPEDVIPQKSSVNFIDSVLEIAYPITYGSSAVYLRPYERIVFESPAVQAAWFREIGASWMIFVPSLFDKLAPQLGSMDTLRHVCVGGEELTRSHAGKFTLYHVYGLSECSGINTIHVVNRNYVYGRIPIGIPADNTYAYVLDEEGGVVPPFIPGHLYIGGECVGAGFLGEPELTAGSFVPDPFRPGERIYRTGDIACWNDEAELIYLHRKDRQVKVRGVRVDPGEIELLLSGHHDVGEAAVVVKTNAGAQQLIAWVTPEEGREPVEATLKAYLRERLQQQAIPSRIVLLKELPRTSTGKIDRVALAIPDPDDLQEGQVLDAPENETQALLAEIWRTVLQVKQVGIRNNYFEIGGHSLNLMVTIAEINRRFPAAVRADDIIRYPTIEKLAALLDGRRQDGGGAPGIIEHAGDPDLLVLNAHEDGLDKLVMLPPFAGISYGYRAMGQYLERKVNLYGINARGMFHPTAALPGSIDEIAADYCRMVKDHVGKDNLFIGGYSASVPVAFEMTKKLEQEGISVKKLFLVDDFFKAATVRITDKQRREMETGELVWALKAFFNVDIERAGHGERWFEDRLDSLGDDESLLGGFRIGEIKRFKAVILNLFDCLVKYRPAGKVMTDVVYFYTDHYGIDHSWHQYAQHGFTCEFLHGRHGTIFLPEEIGKNSDIFLRQFSLDEILHL